MDFVTFLNPGGSQGGARALKVYWSLDNYPCPAPLPAVAGLTTTIQLNVLQNLGYWNWNYSNVHEFGWDVLDLNGNPLEGTYLSFCGAGVKRVNGAVVGPGGGLDFTDCPGVLFDDPVSMQDRSATFSAQDCHLTDFDMSGIGRFGTLTLCGNNMPTARVDAILAICRAMKDASDPMEMWCPSIDLSGTNMGIPTGATGTPNDPMTNPDYLVLIAAPYTWGVSFNGMV